MDGIKFVVLKLLLASAAGLVLGLERSDKHKSLGIKTCIVIGITSCLLTIASIDFALSTGADPMRLASQIVSGIGFLGAGVIFLRDDDVISGLTTAAIVWTAAGFGIAIGAGYYAETILSLVLVHFTVQFLPSIMRKIGPKSLKEQEIYLKVYIEPHILIETVTSQIEGFVINVENVQVKADDKGQRIDMRCFIDDDKGSIFSQYAKIREINGISKIEIIKI